MSSGSLSAIGFLAGYGSLRFSSVLDFHGSLCAYGVLPHYGSLGAFSFLLQRGSLRCSGVLAFHGSLVLSGVLPADGSLSPLGVLYDFGSLTSFVVLPSASARSRCSAFSCPCRLARLYGVHNLTGSLTGIGVLI